LLEAYTESADLYLVVLFGFEVAPLAASADEYFTVSFLTADATRFAPYKRFTPSVHSFAEESCLDAADAPATVLRAFAMPIFLISSIVFWETFTLVFHFDLSIAITISPYLPNTRRSFCPLQYSYYDAP